MCTVSINASFLQDLWTVDKVKVGAVIISLHFSQSTNEEGQVGPLLGTELSVMLAWNGWVFPRGGFCSHQLVNTNEGV